MSDASGGARCGCGCGKSIDRRSGGGRPRDYFDEGHRGRAQRKRDHELRAAVPGFSHLYIAAELRLQADELVTACFSDVPLGRVLELAARIVDDAECVAAAAVVEERSAGRTWSEIGVAAGISEGQARARWGGVRSAQRLSARGPAPRAHWPDGAHPEDSRRIPRDAQRGKRASAALGRALRALREHSKVGFDDLAAEAGMPILAVRWLLEGRVMVPWTTLFTLVHLLGGHPADLRLLWESASTSLSRPSHPTQLANHPAVGLGARLAAGRPAAGSICLPRLSEAEAKAVLDGRHIPEWSELCEVLLWLNTDPEPFKALWEAHRALQGRELT
ncbi:helix-turn-helix domain-containing protein [Streptomyces sp. QL37]|uniref:helix-turn-helix domain-containing protein n=1 Tax=Streptomyces sp. QL37 TaxID=2093747 RepID=UPI000D1C3CC6